MASSSASTSAGGASSASWPLVDPLVIKPDQVEYVWEVTRPPTLPALASRIESICRTEAARLGYDKVTIRYAIRDRSPSSLKNEIDKFPVSQLPPT